MEVVLEPGLGITMEALNAMSTSEATNPGGYLTEAITETREFPLDLAAELLVQRGATEQWFSHRWMARYAKLYLSEWGKQNYAKLPCSRIAGMYHSISPPIAHKQEHPFSSNCTPIITEDEEVANRPFSEDLLAAIPDELIPNINPTTCHGHGNFQDDSLLTFSFLHVHAPYLPFRLLTNLGTHQRQGKTLYKNGR